jgi:steroid delta-isomerase-like uncharacterized protein
MATSHVEATLRANKTLAATFGEEIFNRGNFEMADELVAPDFAWYSPGFPEFGPGAPAVKRFAQALRTAFPDLHLTRVDALAEGDKVADHWVATGTHRAEWMGIPATGKEVVISGIDIFRIEHGKIVELRQIADLLSALRELGIVPTTKLSRA